MSISKKQGLSPVSDAPPDSHSENLSTGRQEIEVPLFWLEEVYGARRTERTTLRPAPYFSYPK